MDHALLMCVVHGVADLAHEPELVVDAERTRRREPIERQPVDEFHREERRRREAVLERPDLVDLRHPGVTQPAEHLGLEPQSRCLGACGQRRPQQLDRDPPVRLVLLGLEHESRRALADPPDHPVAPDVLGPVAHGLAREQRPVQPAHRLVFRPSEQREDLLVQRRVLDADPFQRRGAVLRLEPCDLDEQLLGLRRHAGSSPMARARNSFACAQWRRTVRSSTPSASAASTSVRPPK